MLCKFLEHLDLTNGRNREAFIVRRFNFDFLERVKFVADFCAINLTEGTFTNKLLLLEDVGRAEFELGHSLPLHVLL